ncbi:hypothetical protein V6N13_069309 [Hibiscus sabdariffa]
MAAEQAKSSCQSLCGNLTVPYPFGMEEGCFMEDKFFIRCDNTSTAEPPTAFLSNSTIDVLHIDLDGELRVRNWVGSDCYNSSGPSSNFQTWLISGLYNISSTKNKFIAIGCDTIAIITGTTGQDYTTGCLSLCGGNGSMIVLSFNPCTFGFVVEEGGYTFSTSDLSRSDVNWKLPMVLDWTIGDQNCSEARKDPETYACKENTICLEPEFGNGYLCNCSNGFAGNPYLSNGCQDIDECETLNPCNSICHNTIGGFSCSCPKGYEGNGFRNGTGCSPKVNKGTPVVTQIAIGMSIGFLAIFMFITWSFWAFKQRKTAKMREKYFKQNGGNLLQQLSKSRGHSENDKIFAAEELEKATANFHDSRILGQGGQATVYKGTLPGDRVVAIKKSRIGDQSQVEPFINEIMVLYQINHKHVVRLLGCCLETPVPLLVYEFVTHGSLFDHIHDVAGAAPRSFLPWMTRLRIATETAEALAYLHSAASVPIIHRDVKLANILLDENYTAKVSDFGASRLVPSDQAQMTTMLQGTFGYLDPECMHTGQLTEKSDVYSFGVVLIELLTGRKALCGEGSQEQKVLAKYFVSLMKENRLHDIIDGRMLDNDVKIEQLKEVADLAAQCVRVKGEERPTMKEVAHELAGLQAMERYQWGKRNLQAEESEYLLGGEELGNIYGDYGTTSSIGYDSIKNQVPFELEGAR